MNCHYCKNEDETLALIPVEGQEEWACMPCIKQRGLYCEKHDLVHTKFISPDPDKHEGEHACLLCIEDLVRENADQAESYHDRIRDVISDSELEELTEWAEVAMSVTGDPNLARPVLRAIATYAVRMGKTIEEVVAEIEASPAIKHLLPTHYFM